MQPNLANFIPIPQSDDRAFGFFIAPARKMEFDFERSKSLTNKRKSSHQKCQTIDAGYCQFDHAVTPNAPKASEFDQLEFATKVVFEFRRQLCLNNRDFGMRGLWQECPTPKFDGKFDF